MENSEYLNGTDHSPEAPKKKNVVVVGVSPGGIGEALVREMAKYREYINIIIIDRDPTRIEKIEIAEENEATLLETPVNIVPGNIEETKASMKNAVKEVKEKLAGEELHEVILAVAGVPRSREAAIEMQKMKKFDKDFPELKRQVVEAIIEICVTGNTEFIKIFEEADIGNNIQYTVLTYRLKILGYINEVKELLDCCVYYLNKNGVKVTSIDVLRIISQSTRAGGLFMALLATYDHLMHEGIKYSDPEIQEVYDKGKEKLEALSFFELLKETTKGLFNAEDGTSLDLTKIGSIHSPEGQKFIKNIEERQEKLKKGGLKPKDLIELTEITEHLRLGTAKIVTQRILHPTPPAPMQQIAHDNIANFGKDGYPLTNIQDTKPTAPTFKDPESGEEWQPEIPNIPQKIVA